MTDDSTRPREPHANQRLDGPEALLTAEWNVADLLLLTPEEESPELGQAAAPPSKGRATPPPLPSQRRRPPTAPTAFTAGAAAPLGATGTAAPLIARPKPRQPELVLRPSVVVAPDMGATLPPRAEREATAALGAADGPGPSSKPRRSRPAFVALGTAVGCVLGYSLWSALVGPAPAEAAPERRVPQFLREAPPPAAPPSAPPAASAPSRSTLPPALAATLARALPPATSEAASTDAGVPVAAPTPEDTAVAAAPPAPPENTALPSPDADSVATHRRAEVLREALEAKQRAPEPEIRAAKARPQRPTAARSAPQPKSSAGNPSSSVPRRVRQAAAAPSPELTGSRPRSVRGGAVPRPLTTYTYEDKALFAVATAPLRVTDITLEPGETLVSQPTAGDGARWVITVIQGGERTHVFVKPLRPGLRTNLTLTTNRRSYFLELSSRDDGSYMAGVVWQYPADESARRRDALAQAERERQNTTTISDVQALRFDYRIEGTSSWTPTRVFDDGSKTFIRFPKPVPQSQEPALFLLRSGGVRGATYVNYRIKGDLYVVDRLFEAAELRLGSDGDEQEVVRITRKH